MRMMIFLLGFILAINPMFAQQRSNIIDINNKIDTLVEPDIITLDVRVTTLQGAGKKGLDEARDMLFSTLKTLGVDIKSSTFVANISSTYNKKGNDAELSQTYSVTVNSSTLAQSIITACQEKKLAVRVSKMELSRIDDLENELYHKALIQARDKASFLAGVYDQKIGKALNISPGYAYNNLVSYANERVGVSDNTSSNSVEPVVQKIKISVSVDVTFALL